MYWALAKIGVSVREMHIQHLFFIIFIFIFAVHLDKKECEIVHGVWKSRVRLGAFLKLFDTLLFGT